MNPRPRPAYFFEDFELDPIKRRLLRNGVPVSVPPRAFELLCCLLERNGEVISKDELLEKIWPGQFVEENNLTVQISNLRKIFGDRKGRHSFIATIPGRGYSFIAEVSRGEIAQGILIESETVSEIIVETEEIAQPSPAVRIESGHRRPRRLRALFAGTVILLVAVVGSAFLYSGSTSNVPAARDFRIRQLTNSGNVSVATISSDGKLFAYVTRERQDQALYVGSIGGGNDLLIRPPEPVSITDLSFTLDGSHVIYVVNGNGKQGTFKKPSFGGPETKLTDRADGYSLSSDGLRVAFFRTDAEGGNHSLIVSNFDGSNESSLVSYPKAEAPVAGSLSWSPDGNRLAFGVTRDSEIFRHDLVVMEFGGKQLRLPLEPWRELSRTTWTRDSSAVLLTAVGVDSWLSVPKYEVVEFRLADKAFRRLTNDLSSYGSSLAYGANSFLTVEHRQQNNIWIAPADDPSSYRQLTKGSFGRYDGLWGLDWTYDGRLAFTRSEGANQVLATMLPDGSDIKQITPSEAIDSMVVGAYEQDLVVFHSNVNGDFDIWRMRSDGSDRRQLTFGRRNYQPFISRDGMWVYYKSWEKANGKGELRRVPIDGGEPEIITSSETSWVSFSPDGQYFAAGLITDKHRLAIFSAADNRIVRQIDLPATSTLGLGTRWTPDSRSVAFRDIYSGIWLQPVEGGPAKKIDGLPDEKLYNFAWSKDGRFFAFVRGEEKRDVVLFE